MAIGTGAAILGSAVIGGVLGSRGSKSAANTQADASRDAQAGNERMFERNVELNKPWHDAGAQTLGTLTQGLNPGGEFNTQFAFDPNNDPGARYRMDQGINAINSNAATRGLLQSGGTLKALTNYGQQAASQEYNNAYNRWNNDISNRFNRLSSVAGLGQTATRDVASMGANLASNNGNLMLQGANAQAAGRVGSTNAITGTLSTLGNWWQNQQAPAAGVGGWGTTGLNNFFNGNGTSGD